MTKIKVGFGLLLLVICFSSAAADAEKSNDPWTGFYVGGVVGYGWADTTINSFNSNTNKFELKYDNNPKGVFGGGVVGYNYVLPTSYPLIIGLEGDISGTDQNETTLQPKPSDPQSAATLKQELDYFATIRGRIGTPIQSFFPYVTGGVAFTRLSAKNTQVSCGPGGCGTTSLGTTENLSASQTGWVAGAGVEYDLSSRLSTKLEYQHMDFGEYNFHASVFPRYGSESLKDDTIRLGINYHF